MAIRLTRLAVWLLVGWLALGGSPAAAATLEARGQAFLLDGKPFDMWGIRVASASQSQELTDHLIAQLDEYRAHGVNTVTVFYMGCSGGYSDPFSPDGTEVDAGHQRRMEQIIQACDRRGMAVIAGIFYQRSENPRLKDWNACREAVRTVARRLKPYRNLILNIANEQNSTRYQPFPWSRVREVPDLLELCRLVKSVDPDRLVGAGGYDHAKNEAIGRSPDVDVLLFDTNGPAPRSGELYERFLAAGITGKPLVNVETFGSWTARFTPQGVFPEEARTAYRNEIEDAARHPGLYVLFHNSPWCQAAAPGERSRYDLGGQGTRDDPGIRWYFEAVKAARSAQTAKAPQTADAPPTALRVHESGQALVDASGRPVFLLADTAWSMSTRLKREEIERYLRHRRGQRFNAVTFVVYAPGRNELVDRQANAYGRPPFETPGGRQDPSRPVTTPGADPADPAQYDFWDHTDYAIDACARLGMYALVLPTWGSGVVGGYSGGAEDDRVFDRVNAYAYGRWLGERYRDRKHVVWMLGGDRSAVEKEQDYRPVFRAMAEGIADGVNGEDRHDGKADYSTTLISYHPKKKAPQSSHWFHADPWLDFNSIQHWPEDQLPALAHDRQLSPPKPTWLFEGRYEGYWKSNYRPEQWGPWQMRQQAWQTVLAGAFGHTYGHERVFGFGKDGADWSRFLDAPGAQSMTHLAHFMNGLSERDLLGRLPDPELLEGDAGRAERLVSDRITAMRNPGGTLAVFYSAAGRGIPVRLERLSGGRHSAAWYNPRSGRWHVDGNETAEQRFFERDIAVGPGTKTRAFSPPGAPGEGQDWVLVLSAGVGP